MYQAKMIEDCDLARRFTRMLYDLHGRLAEHLAASIDLSDVSRLMDLGGGSGVMSMALLRRYPRLTAVVVDVDSVCTAGREIAAENGLEDRITYHPADFLRDELPSGFDMVLECDVDVYDQALFRKVRAALRPEGRFIIVDQLAPAPAVAPPSRLHWALSRSMFEPGFAFMTAAEIQVWLQEAGFPRVSQHAVPPVPGDVARFTSGMTLIEARR
jgi:cyclopropane fatty-acyl-phospholipid synthase-like methyltransferase